MSGFAEFVRQIAADYPRLNIIWSYAQLQRGQR